MNGCLYPEVRSSRLALFYYVCWHENASVTDKMLPYHWGDNLYFVPCPNTGGCMFPSSSRIIAAHETNGQPDGKTHMRPI